MAKSTLVTQASQWKTLDFSERFVACDLKVGTYIQLIELMKSYEYLRSVSSLDIGQRSFTYIFKTQFSQKPLHQSKPNFICAILRKANQSLYKWSRSHDQDGRHAHICGKILQK